MPGIWPTSPFAGRCNIGKIASSTVDYITHSKSRPSASSQAGSDSDVAQVLPAAVIDLLTHFEAPGVPPPPSSRVGDPSLKQRESQPIRLWHLWKHAVFVAWKATGLFSAAVSHTVYGPLRKSWGIEMTLLAAIMRDVYMHTHLADLTTIRMFMSISGLYPVPSDALITPVTFNVRCRNLRGILSDFDQVESGTRELSGEWVVGRRTWERLQAEWQAARRAKFGLDKPPKPQKRKERVVLYLHGGAYYLSSPVTHRMVTIPLSKALDARLFALDYRLAPETRFPGSLHDAVSAYFRMTDDLLIPAENIVVAGDSAGGGLTLALMMYLRDNDYPLPGAAILMSPWVDLTMSCDSWELNAPYDIVPKPIPGDHLNPIACYLGEHMEKYLTHPYASPLFGDFRGLPPMLVQSGDAEVLRDECTLLAHKATRAGVTIRHELYEDAVHVFQSLPFLEQAQQAFHSAREFIRETLKPIDSDSQLSSTQLGSHVEEKLENEINNEKAQVVQGDGSVCTSQEDVFRGDSEKSITDAHVEAVWNDTHAADGQELARDDNEATTEDHQPSWAPKSPSDELRIDFPRRNATRVRNNSVSGHERALGRNRAGSGSGSSLRSRASSITSVASTILRMSPLASPKLLTSDLNKASFSSSRSRSFTSTHTYANSVPSSLRRVKSRTYLKVSDPQALSGSSHITHPPTKDYAIPSSDTGTAPQPSIRRSHSSHPDITVLCEDWANWGPANRTVTFKPDGTNDGGNINDDNLVGVGMRRKKSGSVSSFSGVVIGGGKRWS